MDGKKWSLLFLLVTPVFVVAWRTPSPDDRRDVRELIDRRDARRGIHYHTKRHMLPESEHKIRRATTPKTREVRKKKPSGHLTPLEEDDMDNDEVVSVAIGPPPIRPKYDKVHWKHPPKSGLQNAQNISNVSATNIVKDVLTQLGRELITREVSDEFIFGQYVGNSMKNLTADVKLKMQHEILELIVKYQKINRGETTKPPEEKSTSSNPVTSSMIIKESSRKEPITEKKFSPVNETEETWPDFSNLAKIVG